MALISVVGSTSSWAVPFFDSSISVSRIGTRFLTPEIVHYIAVHLMLIWDLSVNVALTLCLQCRRRKYVETVFQSLPLERPSFSSAKSPLARCGVMTAITVEIWCPRGRVTDLPVAWDLALRRTWVVPEFRRNILPAPSGAEWPLNSGNSDYVSFDPWMWSRHVLSKRRKQHTQRRSVMFPEDRSPQGYGFRNMTFWRSGIYAATFRLRLLCLRAELLGLR
jgi:hypothetical protein